MEHKKRVLLAFLLIATVILLSACAKQAKNNPKPTPTPLSEQAIRRQEHERIHKAYLLDVKTRYSVEDALAVLFVYTDDDPAAHDMTRQDTVDAYKTICYFLEYVCTDEDVFYFTLPKIDK